MDFKAELAFDRYFSAITALPFVTCPKSHTECEWPPLLVTRVQQKAVLKASFLSLVPGNPLQYFHFFVYLSPSQPPGAWDLGTH